MSSRRPQQELDLLLQAFEQAVDLAAAGQVLAGRQCLLRELERVQAAGSNDESWGKAVESLCRQALSCYGQAWDVDVADML